MNASDVHAINHRICRGTRGYGEAMKEGGKENNVVPVLLALGSSCFTCITLKFFLTNIHLFSVVELSRGNTST
jgi:hypothetical protein